MSKPIKVILLKQFGGYNSFRIIDVPPPQIAENCVLVEVKACCVNFSDLYCRQGIFTYKNIEPPFIMGHECAGVVSVIGDNVTKYKVGDRVMCWNFTYGMWAEMVKVPVQQCFPIPETMTFEQAVCIPINYLTAYLAVLDFGHLRPEQSILIQSAAGGVGWAATQLAKSVKNVTVFGTSSVTKHEEIKGNGVDYPIDKTLDFVEEVRKLSPNGVNVVLDCLSGHDFIRSQKLLRHMGRLIHIGVSNIVTGEKKKISSTLKVWWQTKDIKVVDLIQRNQSVCGLHIAKLFEDDPGVFITVLEDLICMYEAGKILPKIDSIWPFDKIVEATRILAEKRNIGKVILVPSLPDEM